MKIAYLFFQYYVLMFYSLYR